MPQNEVIYTPSPNEGALRQGEILSELTKVRLSLDSIQNQSNKTFEPERFSWVIIATQECDLDFDFKARNAGAPTQKFLRETLFFQMKPESEVRPPQGELNADLFRRVKENQVQRFHFFQPVAREQDALGTGIPALIVDFKGYFTMPTDEVYKRLELSETKRRCFLKPPFRDDFSTRSFNYLSRIPLPD